MDAQNMQNKPKVLKESKNRIKVDFERTDAKTRFKEKYTRLAKELITCY